MVRCGDVPGVLAADQAGPRVNGRFTKTLYSLSRVQTLTPFTTLQLGINGQVAGRNLSNGEKFALGGPSGVRAYPSGEGLGDTAFVLNAEVRSTVAKGVTVGAARVGDVQLSAFYDYGHTQQFDNPSSVVLVGPNTYVLKGAGFGLTLGIAGVYDFRLQFARQLGTRPALSAQGRLTDGTAGRNRLIFNTQLYF